MPSPIELAIDRACGEPITREEIRSLAPEVRALNRVADCAVAWRADPTTGRHAELVAAIDALIALGW